MSARRLRSIAGGAAGNVLEWFDFLTYSVFAIYFSRAFFPGDNMTVRLLNAAAIAAVGYVARPLGSWLIGVLADRRGRRQALSLSVTLMSAGSFVIALTPGYGRIGVAAPVILLLARLLQGFSMGGEAGTSATYLAEMAPAGRRGFFVGFVQVTVVFGQLMALGLLLLLQYALLTPAQLDGWGWRIPFAIGGVLALFALVLRRGIDETDAFTRRRVPSRNLLAVLAEHRRAVLICVGMSIGGSVGFYTFTVYAQKFMVNTSGFSRDEATLIATIALVVYMLWQPLFGLVSDWIGRKPVMLCAGVGGTLLTVPIMSALGSTHDFTDALLLKSCWPLHAQRLQRDPLAGQVRDVSHGDTRAGRRAAFRDRELRHGWHDRMGGAAPEAGRARVLVLLLCQRLRGGLTGRLPRHAGNAAALDTIRGSTDARRARSRHRRRGLGLRARPGSRR